MTAGTPPAWRSLRAKPFPLLLRGVALSETVAIRTFPCFDVQNFAANPGASARTLRRLLPPYHTVVRDPVCHHERSQGSALRPDLRYCILQLQIPRFAS